MELVKERKHSSAAGEHSAWASLLRNIERTQCNQAELGVC